MANVRSILSQLTNVDGINSAVVASRDGFVIEAVTNGLDSEAVGAVIATGLGSSEMMGNQLEVGEFSQAMMEYKDGTIVMSAVGDDAILAIVADERGNLGNIRYQVKKMAPALKKVL